MKDFNPIIEDVPSYDLENPQRMEPVIIKSLSKKILGTFFFAAGKEKKPLVIILHGFPGNENNFDVAHAVCRSGKNAVVFHYRGSWGSAGEFSFSNALQDLYNVIDYFSYFEISDKYNIDYKNIFIVGHSMGGMFALLAAMKLPQIRNVASLAGFDFGFFTEYIIKHPEFINDTTKGLMQGAALLQNTNAEVLFKEMVKNKDEWNLVKRANELSGKNILLLAAEYDSVAPLDLHYYPLSKALQTADIQFKSKILKSGHSFTSMRITLITEIMEWMKLIDY